MAIIVSSDSDSDLEVLLQLSDWECDEELLQHSGHVQWRPPRVDEDLSPSEDEVVLCSPLSPDEELVQHGPLHNGDELPQSGSSQSNCQFIQRLGDEMVRQSGSGSQTNDELAQNHSNIDSELVRQNGNDSVVQNNSSRPEESVQPQNNNGSVVRRKRARLHRKVAEMQNLDDLEFTYRFRMSKSAVQVLLTEIMPYVQVTSRRNYGVAPLHQLLLTLRFYALGTMLVSVAEVVGVSKSSACRIVQGISSAIARLYDKHVVLHQKSAINFYKIAQFPRVLGAIDCTHIRIQSPNHSIGDEFKNRAGYFSLNVQAVCDADMRLTNVVARWPGSIDDNIVFDNTDLRTKCDSGAFGNHWLLGDTAYPCRAYLLTPILNAATPNEVRYNEAHVQTWKIIQNTIGLWKRRFPVIAFTLRLKLHNIQNVIISTAVLHNICRDYNLQDIAPEVTLPQLDVPNEEFSPQNMEVQDFGQRAELVNNFFEDLNL